MTKRPGMTTSTNAQQTKHVVGIGQSLAALAGINNEQLVGPMYTTHSSHHTLNPKSAKHLTGTVSYSIAQNPNNQGPSIGKTSRNAKGSQGSALKSNS